MNAITPVAPAERPIDVTIVVFDTGFCSTAVGPFEVFYGAGVLWNRFRGETEHPRFRVRCASIDGRPVTSFYGVTLTPQCALDDIGDTDVVMLMAVDPSHTEGIVKGTTLLPWLRSSYDAGAIIAGLCGGVALLAEAGLLDGRRATTHWAVAELYRQRYPRAQWQVEYFITEDQRVLCGGGVYAAIDLSLYLVEKFCGHAIALECAKSLLVSLPRRMQSGYGVLPLSRPHADAKIRRAEEFLQAHFHHEMTMESLAALVAMSPRNLLRRFKAATGLLPLQYVQRLRVAAAREQLEQGSTSLQKIAAAVGYEDVAFFRHVFKRHTGLTPAEYRQRFGALTVDRGRLPELQTAP